jgi:multicomponent Na+:H+ antiporter subunit E
VNARKRYGVQWRMAVILMLVWVLLLGQLTIGTLVAGFVLGLLVTIVFPLPPVEFHGRFHLIGQLRLAFRLVLDLVRSSFSVALLALKPQTPKSAMVRVDLRSDSDLYQTLISELVSLVPGSIVVEARRSTRTLYLHVLDVHQLSDLEDARQSVLDAEARVIRAYGSAEERATIREGERT